MRAGTQVKGVVRVLTGAQFHGVCSCGWVSLERSAPNHAVDDALGHAGTAGCTPAVPLVVA